MYIYTVVNLRNITDLIKPTYETEIGTMRLLLYLFVVLPNGFRSKKGTVDNPKILIIMIFKVLIYHFKIQIQNFRISDSHFLKNINNQKWNISKYDSWKFKSSKVLENCSEPFQCIVNNIYFQQILTQFNPLSAKGLKTLTVWSRKLAHF